MTRTRARTRSLAVLVTAAALTVPAVGVLPAAQAAGGSSVSISDPGAPTAGDVTLHGQVNVDAAPSTTTVLFAVDASGSTNEPNGRDCNGDGTADPSAEGGDNINNDTVGGDLLDCELAAVRALDSSLAGSTNPTLVGVEAFAGTAAAADLRPEPGSTPFVAPGTVNSDGEPAIRFVTHNLVRNLIKKYTSTPLDPSRTSFDAAVDAALAVLAGAPDGPKYLMLMSDVVKEGNVPGSMANSVSQGRLDALAPSGVRVRTFALGGSAGCAVGTSLYRMAQVTGETCRSVSSPASLTAGVVGAQPATIRDVTVTINGVTVAADIDAVGGWSARFSLGQGSYTATAVAHLTSGETVTTQRAFSVAAAAPGTDPTTVPAPGAVTPGTGAALAAVVGVRRPEPLRAALPKTVRGRVARVGQALGTTAALNGSTVLLQGRRSATVPWVTLSRSTVSSGGYSLTWKRTKAITGLQVVLSARGAYASSSAAVPTARISACTVTKASEQRVLTCHTTAPRRTKARLLSHGVVLDRARVHKGLVTVRTAAKFSGKVLSVDLSKKKHVRLHL